MSDELERLQTAFKALSATARPRVDCPSPDEIWEAAAGGSPNVARRVVDHMAGCASCREAWQFAVEAHRESGARPAAVRAERPRRWTWSIAVATLAAAGILLAIVLPYGNRTEIPASAPPFRGQSPMIESRVAENQALDRSRATLRWSPAGSGAHYSVRVTTMDLTIVATASGLDSPEFTIPQDALAKIPAGARLLWQVSVSLPDGRVATSDAFVVVVH